MKRMMLRGLVVGPVQTNCYFLKNKETDEIVIVDPGAQEERIIGALQRLSGKPMAILLTHGHYDHMCASNELRAYYNIPVYAAKAEAELLKNTMWNLSASWSDRPYTPEIDVYLEDQEVLEIAGFSIQMLLTPGHTEGSCCYWVPEEGVCLSGDTLFCESCGRTDLPTGSMSKMRESLRSLLDLLPEHTEVFPGHGEATTVEMEKQSNPYMG